MSVSLKLGPGFRLYPLLILRVTLETAARHGSRQVPAAATIDGLGLASASKTSFLLVYLSYCMLSTRCIPAWTLVVLRYGAERSTSISDNPSLSVNE